MQLHLGEWLKGERRAEIATSIWHDGRLKTDGSKAKARIIETLPRLKEITILNSGPPWEEKYWLRLLFIYSFKRLPDQVVRLCLRLGIQFSYPFQDHITPHYYLYGTLAIILSFRLLHKVIMESLPEKLLFMCNNLKCITLFTQ